MKLILMLLSISLQIFAQENWTVVNSGTTDNLVDVNFVNDNYGWIISSNGTLLRTSDGGENWNTVTVPYQNLNAIKFVNDNEGWIIGDNGLILKTTDSGNSWLEQSGGQNYTLRDLYFQGNQAGFICGNDGWDGVVLKLMNGGNSWELQYSRSYEKFNSIFFINSGIGWLTGNFGTIYKTSDAGANWDSVSYITSNISGYWYTATIFLDTLNGITCNSYDMTGNHGGEIYKTTDGGYTWNFIDHTAAELRAITREPSTNLLYVVGYNYNAPWMGNSIYYSTNAGNSWIEEANSVYPYLNAIVITPNHTGWVVGFNGTVLKNSNLSSAEISNSAKNFYLYQNYPNPFNPVTKIKYSIPHFSQVQIKVYDILGKEIETIVNEEKPAGTYEVKFSVRGGSAYGGNGSDLPSGVYEYRLTSGSYSAARKLVLVK